MMNKDFDKLKKYFNLTLEINLDDVVIKHIDALSETQLGRIDFVQSEKPCIVLPKEQSIDIRTYIFSLVHELRHLWQIKQANAGNENWERALNTYKSNIGLSKRDYNLQKIEIDANAYACATIIVFFNQQPLLDKIGDSAKEVVAQETSKILDEIMEKIENDV